MAKAEVTAIPNVGAMSDFIGAFDVPSKVTDYFIAAGFPTVGTELRRATPTRWTASFSWMAKAWCWAWRIPGFVEFRARSGRNLSDREASYIGAEYLRERLEQEDEHSLYDVSPAEVTRIIQKLNIR